MNRRKLCLLVFPLLLAGFWPACVVSASEDPPRLTEGWRENLREQARILYAAEYSPERPFSGNDPVAAAWLADTLVRVLAEENVPVFAVDLRQAGEVSPLIKEFDQASYPGSTSLLTLFEPGGEERRLAEQYAEIQMRSAALRVSGRIHPLHGAALEVVNRQTDLLYEAYRRAVRETLQAEVDFDLPSGEPITGAFGPVFFNDKKPESPAHAKAEEIAAGYKNSRDARAQSAFGQFWGPLSDESLRAARAELEADARKTLAETLERVWTKRTQRPSFHQWHEINFEMLDVVGRSLDREMKRYLKETRAKQPQRDQQGDQATTKSEAKAELARYYERMRELGAAERGLRGKVQAAGVVRVRELRRQLQEAR